MPPTPPTSFRLAKADLDQLKHFADLIHLDRSEALRELIPAGPLADAFGYERAAGHLVPKGWLGWLEHYVALAMAQTMLSDRDYPIDPATLPTGRPLSIIELFLRWSAAADKLRDCPYDGGRHSDDALRAIGRPRTWKLAGDGERYRLVSADDSAKG